MIQLDIEDVIRARRTDPSTSHEAARKIRGRVQENYRLIREYLASIDPRDDCYLGIAKGTGLDETEVGRRLGEMRDAGMILVTDRREMPNGNRGTFYRIAGKGQEARGV